jgi:hypothetical protein
MPSLGCREFAAAFAEPDGTEEPIVDTGELGSMLLDLRYSPDGRSTPEFFNAELKQGTLHPPPFSPWEVG